MTPLQTVGADDITGRNECPMHLRISAIAMLPMNERRAYLGVELRSFSHGFAPGEGKRGYIAHKKKPAWAVLNGLLIIETTIAALSRRIKKNCNAMHNNKQEAMKAGLAETTISGIRYGWDDPPEVWEGK